MQQAYYYICAQLKTVTTMYEMLKNCCYCSKKGRWPQSKNFSGSLSLSKTGFFIFKHLQHSTLQPSTKVTKLY